MIIYNPEEQYRCTIIRGKAKTTLDNILPAYANIIDEICPCEKVEFSRAFNQRLSEILKDSEEKTLNNHRTEIAGKLFGMFFEDADGMIYASERTNKYLEDNDQPAFFKDICFKFQFPNGMDKIDHVLERVEQKIEIRQFSYILELLMLAKKSDLELTKHDIGYYVLNSLHVIQGHVPPYVVLGAIKQDKEQGLIKKVAVPGKASSYYMQHINEQLNYLELANLIRIEDGKVHLNDYEQNAIQYLASYWNKKTEFDVYSYDLETHDGRVQFYRAWQQHYSKISTNTDVFTTTIDKLNIKTVTKPTGTNYTILGDEGEAYVYEYEKNRVSDFSHRLISKVIPLGKTKGLGYDIQSVIAEAGDMAEFVKYIEVKSTKRVTVPDINDSTWIDTLNLTRNEWVAATQHKEFYSIYRVYFTQGEVVIFVLNDLYKKDKEGIIRAVPLNYRFDFSNNAVDYKI